MASGTSSGDTNCSASDENQVQHDDVIVKDEDDWCKDLEFDTNLIKIYKEDNMASGTSSGDTNCSGSDENQVQYDDVIVKEEDDWCKDLEFDNNLLKVCKEEIDSDESAVGTQSPVSCDLEKNISTHTSTTISACTLCNKVNKSMSGCKEHVVSHDVEATYKCEQCDKQFNWNSHLKTHMLKHTGHKSFTCTLCNKTFKYKYKLNEHMVSHNVKETYKCKLCDKQFLWKCTLKDHILKHTNVKRYVCTVCNEEFKCQDSLNVHMKSHDVIETYKCEQCDEQFHWKSKLRIHMLTCTNDKLSDTYVIT